MAFKFNAAANGVVDIEITGVIGDDWWSDNPCTSDMVRAELKKVPNATLIRVFVDSDGGDVWHGFGIYQALSEHPARVEVTIGARAQSCASVIAMAGDTIVMPDISKMCAHNPWTRFEGTADELEKRAKDLRSLEDSIVDIYVARTGMSESDIRALMNEDRLMGAKEALDKGFCTELRKPKQKVSALSDSELLSARQELRAMAARRAISAHAAKPTDQPPAPSAPDATSTKEKAMNFALVVAALGLTEGATEIDVATSINGLKSANGEREKLFEALGAKSTDDALGRIKGYREKAERLDAIEVEREQERQAAKAAKKAALITAASVPAHSAKVDPANPHAGKLVPAQKAWAESCSIETLEGWLENAPVVLRGDGNKPPAGNSHNGKKFADMQPLERDALKKSDPDTYNALRQQWIDDGSP